MRKHWVKKVSSMVLEGKVVVYVNTSFYNCRCYTRLNTDSVGGSLSFRFVRRKSFYRP